LVSRLSGKSCRKNWKNNTTSLSEAYLEIFKRIALKVARNISNAQDKERAKDLIQIFQTGLESSKEAKVHKALN
jgi:hypothetical protein